MKTSIKDTVKTPSAAIRHMIKGLQEQSKRSNYVINMRTFGESYCDLSGEIYICVGCAATASVQSIAGINLDPFHIEGVNRRAYHLGFEADELRKFEAAIDELRRGNVFKIMLFFDMSEYSGFVESQMDGICKKYKTHLFLSSADWERKLPLWSELADKLEEVLL